jgi:hypothetical protein|tara:strand:- start:1028 stop:1348 length:321 start_codon:yes stop_codon:yes gene_type:complete
MAYGYDVMQKRIVTAWLIFLGIVMLPILPLIPYSNCWYYSFKRYILEGFKGKIIPVASRRWRGYHCVYQDAEGQLWEYTMKKMPRYMPWWRMFIYKGVERRYRGKI